MRDAIYMYMGAIAIFLFGFVTGLNIAGCANIPLTPCHVPASVRCDGTTAQRCEGGHWYPDMDCSETGQECKITEEGESEVVRCQ